MARSGNQVAERAPPRTASRGTSKSIEKRRRILEAAAKVFSMRGYAEATLSEIAALAGTQAGSLYYYYESRDHLVVDLLRHALVQMDINTSAALAALPKESTARDRLLTLIRTHALSALELDHFVLATRKIVGQVSEEIQQQVKHAPDRYERKWRSVINDAVKEGVLRPEVDPNLLRLFITGAVLHMPSWHKSRGPRSPAEIADALVDTFMRGAEAR